ncbi:MAG: glucans biosynthesis glucosyltransferase MdoH, partial [Rubrivivax sp.]|nr:glucans biosynthesis glucosyltransferase MdoH [Rubrivivax sp.]
LLLAWVGVGLVTALMGALVLVRGDRHTLAPPPAGTPIHRDARTAIVMAICNEDIATVFGGLRATCESLAATGALPLFDVYILSDTNDLVLREAELAAWRELRASLGDAGRIYYRRRRRRSERKAGNVSDFCRRWGAGYRYMVVLDADSTMHGDTLVALVRTMEAHPRTGILQTLPQPVGHDTLHARTQQFAARVSGRLFALGLAYWQLGDSHYWGHNAILRVAPFMAHCRMAPLPGRGGLAGPILSHDFVEAAMMRRAGYEVWLLPTLGGSWEQTPPNLLDELQRDRRWCQGNLQNARLIAEPGWRPAHRAMFATGALSYLVAPLWLALLASGGVGARAAEVSPWAGPVLWSLTLTVLLLPRALGVAAVLWQREQGAHGGRARLLASTALEALLSALQAPVRMLVHSSFVLGALTGLRLEWRSPPRDARAVRWSDAFERVGLLALPAAALALLTLPDASGTALLPIVLALLLAVPLTVMTGSAGLGAALRTRGLLTVVEELRPPRALVRARSVLAFSALLPVARPLRNAAPPAPAWTRAAWAAGAVAMIMTAVLPRQAYGPSLDLEARALALRASSLQAVRSLDQAPLAQAIVRATLRQPEPAFTRLPDRPARYIDDALRWRALQAVEAALSNNLPSS